MRPRVAGRGHHFDLSRTPLTIACHRFFGFYVERIFFSFVALFPSLLLHFFFFFGGGRDIYLAANLLLLDLQIQECVMLLFHRSTWTPSPNVRGNSLLGVLWSSFKNRGDVSRHAPAFCVCLCAAEDYGSKGHDTPFGSMVRRGVG